MCYHPPPAVGGAKAARPIGFREGIKRMNDKQMAAMRTALEERKSEIEREVDSMDAEIRSIGEEQGEEKGGVGNHLAEDGSNVMEAERLSTINGDLRDILNQVNGALQRMDEGTFGTCQRCGKPIGEERLEAFPYVRFCIECQTLSEREQALRTGH